MLKKTGLAIAALVVVAAAPAIAQSPQSDGFEVSATVVSSCTIDVPDLAFGNYDPNSPVPTLAAGTVNVNCSLLTPFDVEINKGTFGSSTTDRKMLLDGGSAANADELLAYKLACLVPPITPAPTGLTCLTNWGEGAEKFTLLGLGVNIPIPLQGTIDPGQVVKTGDFKDTVVTATVTF